MFLVWKKNRTEIKQKKSDIKDRPNIKKSLKLIYELVLELTDGELEEMSRRLVKILVEVLKKDERNV